MFNSLNIAHLFLKAGQLFILCPSPKGEKFLCGKDISQSSDRPAPSPEPVLQSLYYKDSIGTTDKMQI